MDNPTEERLMLSAEAIRRSVIVEMIEAKKLGGPRLTQVNYGRLFIRDYWTLFAIARELNCSIEELASPRENQQSGPRWKDIIDACERLLDDVRDLPDHQRSVVLLRASGAGWRRIYSLFPGRAHFSIVDDNASGVESLWVKRSGDIMLISTCENKNFVAESSKTCYSRPRLKVA